VRGTEGEGRVLMLVGAHIQFNADDRIKVPSFQASPGPVEVALQLKIVDSQILI
jgi:hypothetical protein